MDKLKRQIGYVPPERDSVSKLEDFIAKKISEAETKNKNSPEKIVVSKKTVSINTVSTVPPTLPKITESLKITTWIKTHPEFKWASMCKKIGVSKGNFHRILQSSNPNLKEEHIGSIKLILKQYGYE